MRYVGRAVAIFIQIFLLAIGMAYADPAWIFGMHDNGGESVAIAQGSGFGLL